MSYENPTALNVGAAGTLNGWRVRVSGRVVMGMQEGGETYFWSEYCLADDSGNTATLVYEEAESGPEWKLFREFAPTQPLTVRDAASKKVGDKVSLDGTPTPVTLVGTSRIFHIEGRAPEGMEVGDIASYFNVDTGTRMLVASWTGEEIEFYEGLDAPADSITAAFGLTPGASGAKRTASGEAAGFNVSRSRSSLVPKVVASLLGVVVVFATYACFSNSRSTRTTGSNPPPAAVRKAVPPLALLNGAHGKLAQQSYTVSGHTVVEIARVSGVHDRREYLLQTSGSDGAVLVNGLSGGAKEWHLLRKSKAPLPVLTPFEAAMKRKGTSVNVDGQILQIVDLFHSKTLALDGPGTIGLQPDALEYGFVARDGAEWLIARWNEKQIQYLRGLAIPEPDVLAALGPGPEKN